MVGQEITRQWRATGYGAVTSARSGACDLPYDLASMSRPPVSDVGPIEVMFVCAASFADDSWEGSITNALVNTVGVYRIAEWAERLGCGHIVMAGSASSFAESGLPSSSYGLSKAQGEDVLRWAGAKAGCKTTSFQLPQLCDDQGKCAKHQPWFSRIVTRAWSGQDLMLAPNDQGRNFVHVSDVARAMIGAWKSGLVGVHALTSPEFATYRQIAMMAYEVFGAGGRVVDAPEMKPFRPALYPSASQAAWALLGGERISMRATLEGINAAGTANRFGTA